MDGQDFTFDIIPSLTKEISRAHIAMALGVSTSSISSLKIKLFGPNRNTLKEIGAFFCDLLNEQITLDLVEKGIIDPSQLSPIQKNALGPVPVQKIGDPDCYISCFLTPEYLELLAVAAEIESPDDLGKIGFKIETAFPKVTKIAYDYFVSRISNLEEYMTFDEDIAHEGSSPYFISVLPNASEEAFWNGLSHLLARDPQDLQNNLCLWLIGTNTRLLKQVEDYFCEAIVARVMDDTKQGISNLWSFTDDHGLHVVDTAQPSKELHFLELTDELKAYLWLSLGQIMAGDPADFAAGISVQLSSPEMQLSECAFTYFTEALIDKINYDLANPPAQLHQVVPLPHNPAGLHLVSPRQC